MLEISLLGEQRVALDGSVVAALGAPRSMALVGFLLIHAGAPQRREHIAAQFWPESTDAQARTNLRRELHSLRAGFPQVGTWLQAGGGTLLWRLTPDCALDVAAFETAAETAAKARAAGDDATFRQAAASAVGLYRGELMPALYDDWIVPERDRLRRCCLSLLDELIVLERDAGAYGQAIERARRRIELEPLEEVGYRALLQVQALSGDRAAALQTYHRCVSVLERELGVAPDQATTAEYERLISHAPQEPAAASPAAPRPRARLAGPASSARQARLVGRERELDLLRRRWQEALTGTAGFAVVAGEAGIGKTRLLDELASVV
jgi:DNA-binding SARP family transcriptional activator